MSHSWHQLSVPNFPYRPQPPAVPCVWDHWHTLPNAGHTDRHGFETAMAACSCSCHYLHRDSGSHHAFHSHYPGHHLLLQLSSLSQPCSGKSNWKRVQCSKGELKALTGALWVLTGSLELIEWRAITRRALWLKASENAQGVWVMSENWRNNLAFFNLNLIYCAGLNKNVDVFLVWEKNGKLEYSTYNGNLEQINVYNRMHIFVDCSHEFDKDPSIHYL